MFIERFKELILNEGGKILHGIYVTDIDPEKGKVVDSKGNLYEADLIVDAGGHLSVTQKKRILDYGNYRLTPAAQCLCKVRDMDYEQIHLNYYDDGYAWVFFKNEEIANVGAGRFRTNAVRSLEKFIKDHKFKIVSKIRVDSVSTGGIIPRFSYKKLRVAGEAAGMVFPHSGEGIRPAIIAGMLSVGENYEEKYMKRIGKNIQRYMVFQRILLSEFTESDALDFASIVDEKIATKLFRGDRFIINLKMLTKPRLILKLLPFALKPLKFIFS